MAIFLKPDVGWGQCDAHDCDEFILNRDLIYSGPGFPTGDNSKSFYNGGVQDWFSSRYTAHHITEVQADNNGGPIQWQCGPGFTTPCLVATNHNGWYEGIFTNVNFVPDSKITYEIEFSRRLLRCGTNSASVEVRANNNLINNDGHPFPTGVTADFEVITTKNVGGYNFVNERVCYKPSKAFTQLEFIATNSVEGFITLQDISVKCTTEALTDIILNQNGNVINPVAENMSTVSTFEEYEWDFGDIGSGALNFSTQDNPEHTYIESGTYTVCLKIKDNNGCCSTRCEDVVIDCPIISADFTYSVNCAEISFTPTNPMPGYNYHWTFGDGNTSNIQKPVHSYLLNNSYEVCLTITDVNDCTETSCETVIINCPGLDCLCQPPVGENYTTIHAGMGTNISAIFPNTSSISDMNFLVCGKLIIDKNFRFTGCKFLMDEGSEIYSNDGVSLNMRNSPSIEGCAKMWKGIHVGGTGTFNNNVIKDAMYGIDMGNFATLYLGFNTFLNNFIGLNGYKEIGDRGSLMIFKFDSNVFTCTGSLKPTFNGFPYNDYLTSSNTTWVGVRLYNHNNIRLVATTKFNKNTFQNIRNGVVAVRSSFDLQHASIKNLIPPTSATISGYGIHAFKCTKVNAQFINAENMSKAIFIDGGQLNDPTLTNGITITQNVFKNINIPPDGIGAVQIKYCTGNNFNVQNNQFLQLVGNPIWLIGIKDYSELMVMNNGTEDAPINYLGSGISLNNCSSEVYGLVEDNFLKADATASGISLSNSERISIKNNDINILITLQPNATLAGINVSSTKDSEIRENNIIFTGASSTSGVTGINVQSSPNVLYCCNYISKARNNVRFTGNSAMTRFKQTTMDDALEWGLRLENTAVLGPQFTTNANLDVTNVFGNIWIKKLTARAFGSSGNSSRFQVDPTDSAPSGGIYKPIANPLSWFVDAPVAIETPICDDDMECNEQLYQGHGPWVCGVPVMMSHLQEGMSGLNITPAFVDQTSWTYQNLVYNYMEANPTVANFNTSLANFYNNVPSAMYNYNRLENAIDHLWDLTPTEQAQWDAALVSLQTSLADLDAIISVATETNIATYQSQIDALNLNIEAQESIFDAIQVQVEARIITKATQFRNVVNQLPLTYGFIAEYKTIRNIYLDLILEGRSYVLSNHINTINNIASMCIGTHGNSVEIARELQSLLLLPVTDGEGDCSSATNPRSNSVESNLVQIYPNPTDGKWNIVLEMNKNEKVVKYQLKDITGQEVLSASTRILKGEAHLIDASNLPNGIYFLQLSESGEVFHTQKLIKID